MSEDAAATPTRAGFAAVIGAPNAGKSTLVNALVGQKVSIVTQKVQTTRFPVRGVAMEGASQVILVDTPGVFRPRRRLDRAMVRAAWAGAENADAVVHLVDGEAELADAPDAAQKLARQDAETIVEGLRKSSHKAILAINKIDTVKRDTLLALSQRLFEAGVYDEVFLISAKTGSGVDDLKRRLAALMPESPGSTPPTRRPTCRCASWPPRSPARSSTCASTRSCRTRRPSRPRASPTPKVARRASSRPSTWSATASAPIILGKNGATLKWIGQKAREELIDILDRPVHLFLHVKVQETWAEDRAFYREGGLDYDA